MGKYVPKINNVNDETQTYERRPKIYSKKNLAQNTVSDWSYIKNRLNAKRYFELEPNNLSKMYRKNLINTAVIYAHAVRLYSFKGFTKTRQYRTIQCSC